MADQPPRPKGRARGRARGSTTDQTRRPGEEEQQVQAQAPPVQPAGGNGGGRRQHRGAPRTDPVPMPEQAASVQARQLGESMAAMGLGESSGRGRSRMIPGEERTKPATCVDKRGQSGNQIQLVANFFELLSKPQWVVYQYHVNFDPLVESSFLRKVMMRDHRAHFGEAFLFDGMSDLKTMHKVDTSTDVFSTRRSDDAKIRISVKLVAELAPTHPELQRLFNTQMRKNLDHLKYKLVGRYFYDPAAVSDLPAHNLQIWQGVITAIRQQEEKMMMVVDTTHKVIRSEHALSIIMNIISRSRGQGDYKENVKKELIGAIVMTKYNNKTYSVEDVDFSLSPSNSFERSKGGTITYVDYYKTQYPDARVTDLKQPLLLCKSKEREVKAGVSDQKKIYLVPELCFMTGLTDEMRNNFTLMKDMGNHTRLDPATRVKHLQTFIGRINSHPTIQSEMGAWGIKFANEPIHMDARVVPGEKIMQGPKQSPFDSTKGDFSREMRGNAMHSCYHLDDWVIISTQRDAPLANDFIMNLIKVCGPMGMNVAQPRRCTISVDRINSYIESAKENIHQNTKLVCFVVPNNKKERYDALKKYCCLDAPIPSQVIVARTLSKKQMLMSVATKIGIQLNCKLGGEPWAVHIPIQKKIMIVGFDTYHDSSRRGKSAGAFVASLNSTFTRWYSKVAFHSKGGWEEISNHIERHMTEALRKFFEFNKQAPDMVLFFRDGVGDGQIRYVKDMEVKACRKRLRECVKDKETKLAFIVVNKKINQRFFQFNRNQYSNPPPGTVIDHTVTRFDRYDFYLISQSVRQGTVGPTLYNVIDDDTGLKPEHIQRLAYKLTHLYFNWQGTIRVPAPCQYAHKLAFLVGQSLHEEPKEVLCDKLFYL